MDKNEYTLPIDAQKTGLFSEMLLAWFDENKRDLPFRQTKDPYNIWVSEIMAQQTQIDTLVPYYERFISAFPTVADLAAADEASILKQWAGLGYYSRARNLHKAAQIIVTDYDGQMPKSYKELLALPGIGPYTGGAIASIAYNERVSAVDGNVLRVITRINNCNGDITEDKIKKAITQWVIAALPDRVGDYNEALMELGALICTPKAPRCLICPVKSLCVALTAGTAEKLPVKSKKIKQKTIHLEVAIVDNHGKIYLQKRPDKGLLSNLWGFPTAVADKTPGHAITAELKKTFPTADSIADGVIDLGRDKHAFSHIIWQIHIFYFDLPMDGVAEKEELYGTNQSAFVALDKLDNYALPVAFSKLLKYLPSP